MSGGEVTGAGRRSTVLLLAFDSEELTIRLAGGLADHTQVVLMLPRDRSLPYLRHLDERVIFLPFDRPRLREVAKQVRMLFRLVWRIRALDPDIIHIQKWHLWFYLALPLIRRFPLVISVHDPTRHSGDSGQAKTPMRIVEFGYRRADRIITHNQEMKDTLVSNLDFSAEKVDVIPLMERGDADMATDVQEPGNEILFFGRIWPYKGLDVLIHAQPMISARFPEAKIIIAGTGEDFERYRQMMVEPDRFEIFDEFVPEELLARLFRRASVVVLPYKDATQSGVIPVAYTFEKPVVATSVGGLPSQVEDGHTGLLVPPDDPEGLSKAIVRLLEDPDLRAQLGRNGNHKLRTEWSAEAIARETMRTYERLLVTADLSDEAPRSEGELDVF